MRVQPVHGLGQAPEAPSPKLVEQLGVKQLLAVFPFITAPWIRQALRSCMRINGTSKNLGHALGELGLAHAGGAFDEDGLFEVKTDGAEVAIAGLAM